MGLIYSDTELINSDDPAPVRRGCLKETEVRKMKVKALADSGVIMILCSVPQI